MDAQEQIERFKEFIEKYYKNQLYDLIARGKKSLTIDFQELAQYELELSGQLLQEPEEVTRAAELALEHIDLPQEHPISHVRFSKLPNDRRIKISNVRSDHLGKFLMVEGIVRQASDVRPQVTSAKFECAGCGNTITVLQIDTKFKEPSRCTCGWRGKFRLLAKDLIDVQHLKIEEAPENLDGGEQPKRLSIFLKEDLVEPKMEKKTTPGSRVYIYGVVKEVPIQLKTGAQSVRYDLIMEANNVEPVQEDFSEIQLSKEDEESIQSIAKDPHIFERLTHSIAPSIYGHEKIKEALVLQLMGGVRKQKPDGIITRGDIHILCVGDPGSGKSQILQFMSKAAPKARFVSGKGASGAGLTAAVVKDEFLKGWALEAGALVLANKGLCVVDELDKIDKEDTAALHSAMEQQIIPISKANIQACYSEDTEVLTELGWRDYSHVGNLKIAQYSPKSSTVTFSPHKGLYVYNCKDFMYHFKDKRNDILVTPNHTMLFKETRHKEYRASQADKIPHSRIKFLNSALLDNPASDYFILPPVKHKQNRTHPKYTHQHHGKKIPMDLWLEFLGYYLTEGGIETEPTISISQKHGPKADTIKKCLLKLSNYLGCKLTEIKDPHYSWFKITQTQLCSFIKTIASGKDDKKTCHLNLSLLSKNQLEILYNAMLLGDGSSDKKSYGSTSLDLMNLFQATACLLGKSASLHLHYAKNYRPNRKAMYRISLSGNNKPTFNMRSLKKIKYTKKVYCFATETGFFVTRRNGKVAIQGNTLTAQTTLLAAANPKLGRFDPYTPIASQIDLPSTLINRFDLIFPVRDIPNLETDTKIALHVLETSHSAETYLTNVSISLLRKYVSYSKRITPQLTQEAIAEIKTFYVNLRNSATPNNDGVKPIPISARQLEGLIRLTEASARVRLDPNITKQDARRAIDLMQYCLMQVGFDRETGQIDIDRISTGITAATRSKIITVKEIIISLENRGQKTIPIDDILAEAAKKGIEEHKVEDAIEQLKKTGDVFLPKPGYIQRI